MYVHTYACMYCTYAHMYMHAQRNTHFVITLVSLKDGGIAELPTYVKTQYMNCCLQKYKYIRSY